MSRDREVLRFPWGSRDDTETNARVWRTVDGSHESKSFDHRSGFRYWTRDRARIFRGGRNIRANAIAPGAVGGQRIENVLAGRAKAEGRSVDEERASMLGIQSLKRFVDPKDIAALCVFLASDAGKSISGQVIPIDNGALKAS